MAPSWLPQNIQKRVFRYVLNKLALFSNLDLHNLDVSLGTTLSHLALHDVQLDTEKLKIPGIYVRDGKLANVDIDLEVVGGVTVKGKGIELTVALSQRSDDLSELSELLRQTTMDIAESIMGQEEEEGRKTQEEEEGESEEGEETGYGFGEFGGVVSRMVDAAVSQLKISLEDMKITVVAEDTTLAVTVDSVQFSTSADRTRRVVLGKFTAGVVVSENRRRDSVSSESDFSDDDNELMQSTLFSHEQASSMYMSAMSTVMASKHVALTPLMECDGATITFHSLALSGLEIEFGNITLEAESIPKALSPIARFVSSELRSAQRMKEKEEERVPLHDDIVEDGDQFSFKALRIKRIALDFGGAVGAEFPVRLVLNAFNFNAVDSVFEVRKIEMNRGDDLIFSFEQSDNPDLSSSNSDLTVRMSPENVTVLLPKAASFELIMNDILQLMHGATRLGELVAKLDIPTPPDQPPTRVNGQTNAIKGRINTGQRNLEIEFMPLSIDSDVVSLGTSRVELGSAEYIEVGPSRINLSADKSTVVRLQDSSDKLVRIKKLFSVDQIKANVSQDTVGVLYEDLTPLLSLLSTKAPPQPSEVPQTGRPQVKFDEECTLFTARIKSVNCQITLPGSMGTFDVDFHDLEVNTLPGDRMQSKIGTVYVTRDFSDIDSSVRYEPIVHHANPSNKDRPMISIDMADGKLSAVRLHNIAFEYHVRLAQLFEEDKPTAKEEPNLENSTDTIKDDELNIPIYVIDCMIGLNPVGIPSKGQLVLHDATCKLQGSVHGGINFNALVRKSALLLIDDVAYLEPIGKDDPRPGRRQQTLVPKSNDQVSTLKKQGYKPAASLLSIRADAVISARQLPKVHLEVSSELISLETCADSTQTLLLLLNGLKPPVEELDNLAKFQTEIPPVNVFEDVVEDQYINPKRYGMGFDSDISGNNDFVADDLPSNLDFVESYYGDKVTRSQWTGLSTSSTSSNHTEYSKADLLLDQDLSMLAARGNSKGSSRRAAVFEQRAQSYDSMLDFSENHFAKAHSGIMIGTDNMTNSSSEEDNNGTPESGLMLRKRSKGAIRVPPIVITVRETAVIWNLHDGYDWIHTQDTINNAVKRVEVQADEINREMDRVRQSQVLQRSATPTQANYELAQANGPAGTNLDDDDDDDNDDNMLEYEDDAAVPVVGDYLFNSIYIGIPAGRDPRELRQVINEDINDDESDSMSLASNHSGSTIRSSSKTRTAAGRGDRLKLKRSRHPKVRIELRGLNCDISVFGGVNDEPPPLKRTKSGKGDNKDGALLNRVDIRVRDLEIIDKVPTSTWNKFVSYMRSAGERESDANMAHIIMDTVKPVAKLATCEVILNVSVLPLRLHVDQDTLEFVTRFFEFKDERFIDRNAPEETVFIQKIDVKAVRVKLDYKPKKVDYAGLKSGHITEFMNFFILDEAEMVLRRVVLYGVDGFPKMTQLLHGTWMPDIRTTQLGDVLSGIAPVRSLIRLGSGVKDLVAVPVREYRKDGRLVRSLQKGAWSFAQTTTNELVKFGAKLAAGTQTILESAEQVMGGTGATARAAEMDHRTRRNRQGRNANNSQYVSPYSDDLDDLSYSSEGIDEDANGRYDKEEEDEKRKISLYANQPSGVAQGLQVAYNSLGRNLSMAKEAVYDIRHQAAENGGNAQDAAVAVAKAAPIALIRPMIGATEAVSKALLGVTNQLDPEQRQEAEEKYKRTG
ncbi:autophagy-related protein 2 [Trichomonascus vanleenenianus]|uniref:Atg2p n=1 Tax=Trichomonascus vanleenenianus TaxID=2268995 RepID=UPI003ECB9054